MSQLKTQSEFQATAARRIQIFLSVVIPAYNERENLPHTLEELKTVIRQSDSIGECEIIVVDDHSTDDTLEWIRSLNDKNIHCIRLSRRSGSHTAIRAGMTCTRGDAVLFISADGQENPYILNQMLGKLHDGAQVVWGVRKQRQEPWPAKLLATAAYQLIDSLISPNARKQNFVHADFYLLSRKAVDAVNRCQERHTSLFGLILWLGFKQDFIEYERRPRRIGKSKWKATNHLRLLIDWIVAFSGIPLKLISFLGILTAALGFLYAFFIVIYTLLGYSKPGWAETVVLILVLGGAQMMMLGVIGEYLWRTLDETRQRPLYFIEDRTDE